MLGKHLIIGKNASILYNEDSRIKIFENDLDTHRSKLRDLREKLNI